MALDYILSRAMKVLGGYPLCDRCLGRLFARLGYGWSNRERGDAIKRLLVMELHSRIREGDRVAAEEFKSLAPNIGVQALGLYREIFGDDFEPRECSICGGRLEKVIDDSVREGERLLRIHDVDRFLVGVIADRGVLELEDKIKIEYGLEYGESIKSEIRREVGKRLRDRGFTVDFDDPQAMILVGFPSGSVEIQVNSVLFKARYWKLGRMISQAYWPTVDGPKYFSVEEALWEVMRLLGGESVVVHAAGREDVDARMLGTGRPVIVEVKRPRRRRVDLALVEKEANKGGRGLVVFRFEGHATRGEVRLYKEEVATHVKTYKALIALRGEVSRDDVSRLEDELSGRVVLQRTPSRVLHRRPDILRRKRVHRITCRAITGSVIECLIRAEGGLYIKELVSGDDGRTTPSVAEVLGVEARCVELDVVSVEGPTETLNSP